MIWKAADCLPEMQASLIRFLMLSGQRNREVCQLQSIDIDGDWWVLKSERSKNKLDNHIFLTEFTRSFLPVYKNEGPYLFSAKGAVPMVLGDKIKKRMNAGLVIPHWKFHHFRHAFTTHLNEAGCAPHLVDACLGHLSSARTGIAGVYNHSDYRRQKREVFQRWSDMIEEVVNG